MEFDRSALRSRPAVAPFDLGLFDVVESGSRVRVLGYPVFFADGRWYADVELPGVAAVSYSPFVHLALARFQPESLPGLSLSTTVQTDMVPLLPDRSLEVHTEADGLHVSLTGRNREGVRPNQVIATLERTDSPDLPDAPVELTSLTAGAPQFPAWVRVSGATVTGGTNTPLPPVPVSAGSSRLRLVIRETEDLDRSPDGGVDAARELSERTVYADIVSLPLA